MSNDDQLCFLLLNQSSDVVEAVFHNTRFLGLGCLALSHGLKTLFLLNLRLRLVLLQEAEEVGSCLLVKSHGELVDAWGDLESLVKSLLLSLETDIFGPFDESGEISLGLDISSNTEVLCLLLDQRVGLGDLGCLGSGIRGSWGLADLFNLRHDYPELIGLDFNLKKKRWKEGFYDANGTTKDRTVSTKERRKGRAEWQEQPWL